ncbi:dual specificity protein phosphatase 12-like [Oppia nitens]|uniref:dual specificity protein phosphatase 12-like n=1 Tax=Oppia nitens TaxID=1686743 RepID=UPI0023DB4298|nr:dual specificity protein phosphatase 12-like [Oppia nitens]
MVIKQEDMHLPVDYSMIEDNLFLGNVMAAHDLDVMRLIGTRRVLTVRNVGIDDSCRLPDVQYGHIQLNDTHNDDLLTHFPRAHRFIDNGLSQSQPVYVHCRMGRSRSVTIVVSYIMWRDRIGYREAMRRVRQRRPIARPNSGFRFQLKLFEAMNYSFDPLNHQFREYLLNRFLYVCQKRIVYGIVDTDQTIQHKFFAILQSTAIDDDQFGCQYQCARCRSVLFSDIQVLRYNKCFVFTEPTAWLSANVYSQVSGSVQCPQCLAPIGLFNWRQFCRIKFTTDSIGRQSSLRQLCVFKFYLNELIY